MNHRKRQLRDEPVTHDVVVGVFFHIFLAIYKLCASWLFHDSFTIKCASTNQRETKRQRKREKYASMREIYQQKKVEKEAARNNIENIGIIFFQN